MTDFNQYVGLPFMDAGRGGEGSRFGFDCYGLVRHILMQEKNILMPKYSLKVYDRSTAKTLAQDLKELMAGTGDFPSGWTTVEGSIQAFDVLWLKTLYPVHYGLAVSDKKFIHVELGKDSVIEPVYGDRWSNKLLGVYRHDSLCC